MTRTNDIRDRFLTYFRDHDHSIVDSSPLVPHNDSTLLFTNSGMVQFKNIFTGQEATTIKRATTSQKCVRAGGKHNDLENVGHTARHHTFFEMLGNFSFGDYFKERAIDLAWTLITKEFGLPQDRLLVTIYHDDDDAAGFWRKIAGLDDRRIIRIKTSDNFWSMGETGPCGPCSEIFYDHGESIDGGPPGSANDDGDRFVEIWNLVFMQYEQVDAKTRTDLPRPSIDTGMGLERIAAILQGKHDNYDIDLIRNLITATAEASATKVDGDHRIAQRVIADHLRASCFLITDGVLPANEGRGYVLRRIMRRAMRHAHQMGCKDPLLHKLVPALVAEMGGHYTELKRAESLMTEVLKLEEERFKQTLGRGLAILNESVAAAKSSKKMLGGDIAFKLYDTYGFPLDLTEDVLKQHGWRVDKVGFDNAMDKQKQIARQAWAGSGDSDVSGEMRALHNLAAKFSPSEFLGYETLTAAAQVLALIKDGKEVKALGKGDVGFLIVNQAPFYAEAGGQEGDHGAVLDDAGGAVLGRVSNTWKSGGVFFHAITAEGKLAVADGVLLAVDGGRRQALRCNHSATHLLHAALRQHLGGHVTQKGALVAEDRLRFDFSHPKAVTADELATIESTVNQRLCLNSEVATHIMTKDAAIAEGALALFGEKYGDEVRVVTMGGADAGKAKKSASKKLAWSVELCGGTHVGRTGEIGLVKIIAQSAVGSGVRRLEAVTRDVALDWVNRRLDIMQQSAGLLKTAPDSLGERLAALLDERRKHEAEIKTLRQQVATGGGDVHKAEMLGDIAFVYRELADTPAKELRPMTEGLLKTMAGNGNKSNVAIVATVFEGKPSFVAGLTKSLADSGRLDAIKLARLGSEVLGGKGGGGRPDMAQAGGVHADKLPDAIAKIKEAVRAG